MLEEPLGVLCSHRIQRPPHRLYQGLAGSCSCPPQQTLDLRKRLLYGVEVRRVGRQVDQVAASRFDQLPDLLALMDREVVHHDHLADPQARSEYPIDVGLEENLRGRAFHRKHCPMPPTLMLAMRVVFLPRLRGTSRYTRSPRGE